MAGLVSVMPLTGLLVMVWVYLENKGNPEIMQSFTKGALWGSLPTFLFFTATFFCFKKNLPLSITLAASFSVWLGAAVVHQWILK